jgi:hypothetical protein
LFDAVVARTPSRHEAQLMKPPVSARNDLASSTLVEKFLEACREEDPALAKSVGALDEHGRVELGGVLGRFERGGRGELSAQERLFARRVLGKLRHVDVDSLSQTNKVLDYLDLNANASIDEEELSICSEIFELFAHADSDNDTLSEKELDMLYAVLRHIDADDSKRFERHERQALRDGLRDPRMFLEKQKQENPLLRAILAR